MGNIAHELRTPMTTIKGFVDGILDGTIPPDMQNHYLQLVSEETGRLARLIQNMLDLSKLESGEYQVNARMFNIWETLTGVALAAEQRINDGMIELEGLTMDEKVLVYADPDLIHQVAYNLLDNAIKFTPAGGTIRFSVEKLGPKPRSPSGTPVRASARRRCPMCLSGSTRRTAPAACTPAAPALG